MNFIIKISNRNVFRHLRRNTLIGISIAFSVGLLFFILSLAKGIEEELILGIIQGESGVATVQPSKDLLTGNASEEILTQFSSSIDQITQLENVTGFRERMVLTAFLYYNDNSERITLKGISPLNEQMLINTFTFSTDTVNNVEADGSVYLSQGLAEKLGLVIGDMFAIMAQTIHNSLNLYDFYVAGIYTNISGWDNSVVYAHLENVKDLYMAELPTHFLIDSDKPEKAEKLKTALKGVFPPQEKDEIYKLSIFSDSLGIAHIVSNANKYGFLSVVIFIMLMSFVGIGFLVINNLIERNNEIGTLLALGFKPLQIRSIFIVESFIIGCVATITGLAIFSVLVYFTSISGINIGSSAAMVFGNDTLHPLFDLINFIAAIIVGLTYPIIAALFGTRRVKKIDPVEALKIRTI